MSEACRIAVVQAGDGHLTVCGPHDFKASEFNDAMDAAVSWHLEAGWLPIACYWVDANIPPAPSLPQLKAQVSNGSFPKQFFDDLPEQPSPGQEE